MRRILQAVLTGLILGAIIFLIAAAAEPLYRERFGGRLSLPSLLRPRALRTKEFFIAAVVGLTMTCFFFAYENVFYLIANALGAWSPREVAYSDLLSTVFPWAYVLFFGWFPAISEEFTSRMFSIPFLERALRNRAVAIVLAAAIWGFGHATYPNQPFWIRGVEVGLAGIVFGLVFLRFGIVPVVIAHFSVDALYTAFVLIRSESPYYVITGSLSAGIFAVVFLGALVAYVRRGGFLPAELTNEAETAAQQSEEEAARAASAARAAVEGEGRDEPAPGRAASMYVPLSGRSVNSGNGSTSRRPASGRSSPRRPSCEARDSTSRRTAAQQRAWTGPRRMLRSISTRPEGSRSRARFTRTASRRRSGACASSCRDRRRSTGCRSIPRRGRSWGSRASFPKTRPERSSRRTRRSGSRRHSQPRAGRTPRRES